MYMCLVLFVVSKILDSSELLSCLLEMGAEYYLVCIREGLLRGKGVEPPRGRGRLSGARESQPFFGVYYNKNAFKDIGSECFVDCLSCVYIYMYMFGWLCRATCCSVVSTSMLGVSHAVQNEKKLWKFTQSDRWGNGARSTGGDV